MKNLLIATAVIAVLAPSVTLAESYPFDFPTFSDEFGAKSELVVQPVTKLTISTENETIAAPAKSDEQE
jgi:hypothetical protein